jgi:hypothetical protein
LDISAISIAQVVSEPEGQSWATGADQGKIAACARRENLASVENEEMKVKWHYQRERIVQVGKEEPAIED